MKAEKNKEDCQRWRSSLWSKDGETRFKSRSSGL